MIEDKHRVAALMYVSCQKDTATYLGKLIPREVWEHLVERELIYRPIGWPVTDFTVTIQGKQFLAAALR